jgi:hypothetical protein
MRLSLLQIIIEVVFSPYPTPHRENMGRDDLRIELHIITGAMPQVASITK